jgi:hypothetical protein
MLANKQLHSQKEIFIIAQVDKQTPDLLQDGTQYVKVFLSYSKGWLSDSSGRAPA